jgi:non-heme chloroperoxidase
MTELEHRTLANGHRFEIARQGPRQSNSTTVLLLLHGITDSWRSFEPVMPLLPSAWQVLAMTQRGHGGSDKPLRGYRTRDFASDAALLLRDLGVERAVVVGHSMGAANAMRLAIDHPSRVAGLVAAGAFASFADKPELHHFVREQIEPLSDPVPRALADAFQRDTLAQPVAESLISRMVDESLRVPARVWRDAFAGLLDDDFGAELRRIVAPTLLIAGARDAFVPASDTTRLARLLPHARVSRWDSAGHAMHWEEPARFARELVHFVGEVALAA